MSVWNSRYDTSEFIFGIEPNDFLREQADCLTPHSRILCIGEGEGRNAVFLAGLGHEVTAIDASEIGLAKAQKLAESRGLSIQTIHADLSHFIWEPEDWDAIISIFCHLPPQLRKSVNQGITTSLKRKGFFLLEAYTIDQHQYKTGGPSDPLMMYSKSMLQEDFAGFSFPVLRELVRNIQEGSAHVGQSAVVQCFAQRPE